jgi:hypothetical protein
MAGSLATVYAIDPQVGYNDDPEDLEEFDPVPGQKTW